MSRPMKLVPADVLEYNTPPVQKQLITLDKEMKYVMDSSLNAYEKHIEYFDRLLRYLRIKHRKSGSDRPVNIAAQPSKEEVGEKQATEPNLPVSSAQRSSERIFQKERSSSNPSLIRKIVDGIPQGRKRVAQKLLSTLAKSDDTSWTQSGELIYKDRLIPDSNLKTVVLDLMTNASSAPPEGSKQVVDALRKQHFNLQLIRNSARVSPKKRFEPYRLRRSAQKFNYEIDSED